MASIAAAFDSSRRRDDLTWSHHVAVAGLPERDQETWLDRAAAESLSVADLRTELRAAPKGKGCASVQLEDDPGAQPSTEPGGQGPEADVLCPQCGYRLARENLG
jgi:hypothetical protein